MRLIVTYEWVLLYTWMKHLYGNMSVGIHMDEGRHTSGVVTNVKGLLRFCFEKLFSCCFIRVNTACHTYGRDVSHMRIRHGTWITSHGTWMTSHGTQMWRGMWEYANSSCYTTHLKLVCGFALSSFYQTCHIYTDTPRVKSHRWMIHLTQIPLWGGVATISRIDKIIVLFCRISSLLKVSFAEETYNLIDPTNCSHPIRVHVCSLLCSPLSRP